MLAAFQTEFGFVPCYVNTRLTAMGIPVACEVDIYGALSELIGCSADRRKRHLLDINNTVPDSLYRSTCTALHRLRPEGRIYGVPLRQYPRLQTTQPGVEKSADYGTYPAAGGHTGHSGGTILPGDVTLFRHGTPDGRLSAYIAQGEVLDAEDGSFGSRGIIAVPDMGRFYRHVLLENHFP